MEKPHPLSTPTVVKHLETEINQFLPKEKDEEVVGPKVSYLNAIGALMYLA